MLKGNIYFSRTIHSSSGTNPIVKWWVPGFPPPPLSGEWLMKLATLLVLLPMKS